MKPMLAAKANLQLLRYPLYMSPKLDGVRCVVKNGQLLSRSLKPIPNHYIQSIRFPDYVDGELIVGSPTAPDVYRKTVSAVMSHSWKGDFTFYVFDNFLYHNSPYSVRRKELEHVVPICSTNIVLLQSWKAISLSQVQLFEQKMIERGYEGAILRYENASYKFGRSTVREGALLKLKRFKDGEAEIIDIVERFHNANPAFENELGYTAHTQHQENKIPMNTMGALWVRDLKTHVEFKVGTGFDDDERLEFWQNQSLMIGETIKYKYFAVGVKDKPRHPVFLGFRNKEDMS